MCTVGRFWVERRVSTTKLRHIPPRHHVKKRRPPWIRPTEQTRLSPNLSKSISHTQRVKMTNNTTTSMGIAPFSTTSDHIDLGSDYRAVLIKLCLHSALWERPSKNKTGQQQGNQTPSVRQRWSGQKASPSVRLQSVTFP